MQNAFLITGNAGREISLRANYFKLNSKYEWVLYQYRVDMTVPKDEKARTKKQLLYQQREYIGAYLFDGSVLYTTKRLEQVSIVIDYY